MHTGLTYDEIDRDLEEKKTILDWLVKNDVHNVQDVGVVMAKYYMDRASVYKAVVAGKKGIDI